MQLLFKILRGRYKSGDEFYHGINETTDGYDTLEWIAAQKWSNCRIGMTGKSYLAAVQCAAAISGSEHLSSVFHVKAPSDYYQNGFRNGGALLMYSVPIAFMFASSSPKALVNPVIGENLIDCFERHSSEWLGRMPIKKGLTPLRHVPEYERWLFDVMEHTEYDDYWKKVPLWQPMEFRDQYADIPSYYVGGWYDLYKEETFYVQLARQKKQPIKLLMGPWDHVSFGRCAGDVDFGPAAELSIKDYYALLLKWFDRTLKDIENGITEESSVKIFVMGGGDGRKNEHGKMRHGGEWRLEDEWPLQRTKYTEYYFHGDGLLSPTKPSEEKSLSNYHYDPKDPVPTIGGTSYFFKGIDADSGLLDTYIPYGPHDQKESTEYFHCKSHLPLSSRQDVLVFQSLPLTEDIEVTGPLKIKLWASSSAIDTDFTAKLIVEYPPNEDYVDGYAMNISDGIIRARFRNGFEVEEFMSAGEIYEFTITIHSTSNLFKRGHRIRVDISSSNFPTYDPNPNTCNLLKPGNVHVIAENTIYHDAMHPSCIILPVIPDTK